MQIANIIVSIGGDNRNQVPKFNVTPAEVAVLRVIHGEDAVIDIEPTGEINRSNREERQRLAHVYSHVMPDGTRRAPAVDNLFPGVAARVFENFDEMDDLPEEFFKAERRVSMKPRAANKAEPVASTPKVKRGKKAEPIEEPVVEEPVAEAEIDEIEDGIGEINDGVAEPENLFQ